MQGGDEQPVKKAKIHSLRKFDDKIAVQKQRQEETDEQFKEAMRNIGQLKDPFALTQLQSNLPHIPPVSVDIPSPQNSNISMRSPPSTLDFRTPGRLDWEMTPTGFDDINSRRYHHIKRGSGRRRSTGHASNDIRNSTSPYPVIRHEPMQASYPPQLNEKGMSSSLISRVKSDSDLQRSLENSCKDSPLAGPNTPYQPGSTPTPDTSQLHPPQSIPQQWSAAAKYRQTMAGPGSIRKHLPSLRKRSHNASEQIDNYFPSPAQQSASINPKVTSLPDLTDINFHSGLDNPLDYDEISNMSNYTPTEPLMGNRAMTPQQNPPIPSHFPQQAPPLFQPQQPHDRILSQATQFGYYDDAYLHLQSEPPHFYSGPKKMFNSSLSIPESHPLTYAAYPPNSVGIAANQPHMQRQEQLRNGMGLVPEPFPIGLTACTPEELAPSGMGLCRENMFERPTSSCSMPPHPLHARDISQSQNFRGLDLHSTTAAPFLGYGSDQLQFVNNPGPVTGLMLNPNLHKSDPLLQSIGPEGNVMQSLPGQLGFSDDILDFEESPIGPELCIPELQLGSLRKGHSYDFKPAFFSGNKTPVPDSYTNLSKFSSFPEMMSDGGLNPRDSRGHSHPFMIDNNDSVIDRLIEKDATTQLNANLIPEDAQNILHSYAKDRSFYPQNYSFDDSFFLK